MIYFNANIKYDYNAYSGKITKEKLVKVLKELCTNKK